MPSRQIVHRKSALIVNDGDVRFAQTEVALIGSSGILQHNAAVCRDCPDLDNECWPHHERHIE